MSEEEDEESTIKQLRDEKDALLRDFFQQNDPFQPKEFELNLLLSAKAAKFFKLKSPQLVSMSGWSKSWDDPKHHWLANWRCEECFSMKKTKDRIFMVTNEASRYSLLLRLASGQIEKLFVELANKIRLALRQQDCHCPVSVRLLITTLSGAARSLTSFQNQQLWMLDGFMEGGDFEFLDDLEPKLNFTVTTIKGEMKFADREFQRLCKESPPFGENEKSPSNVIPFRN